MSRASSHAIRLFIVVVFGFCLSACGLLSDDPGNGRISVNSDSTDLNARIEIVNEPIDFGAEGSGSSAKNAMMDDAFIHVANIKSPIGKDGSPLSATSVEVRANAIYVSYHKHGNPYEGAVDMIDVRHHEHPEILSSISMADTDINALEIEDNGKVLWITGGTPTQASTKGKEGHNGAIVGEVAVSHKEFVADDYTEVTLPGYSGNAIVEMGSRLYVASGATGGGFFALDKASKEFKMSIPNDYAKWLTRGRSLIMVGLSLKDGSTAKMDLVDYVTERIYSYETDVSVTPNDGKNVLEYHDGVIYASLGFEGVRGYRWDFHGDYVAYEFKAPGGGAANGVTVDDRYVYIANGVEGLYITSRPHGANKQPDVVHNWTAGAGSANFVETDGKYIVVANGTDGLNILRKASVR